MKSSSGEHYLALDHVRALAAFLVFSWHFTAWLWPADEAPGLFPLSLVHQGYTGVALFMTLSGYLFAKLLDSKSIRYGAFIWNRMVRLLPLLVVVMVVVGVGWQRQGQEGYALAMLKGFVLPTWPNGGWSIAIELQFYVILPILLWALRRSRWLPLVVVGMAILARSLLSQSFGHIQGISYSTLCGRIDQFVLGMMAFHFRHAISRNGRAVAGGAIAFMLLAWAFDLLGGFHRFPHRNVWIVIPTIEGLAYAAAIAWYDTACAGCCGWMSRALARVGECSYSLYLLHPFFVRDVALLVKGLIPIPSYYAAAGLALAAFAAMVPIAWLSYTCIERPWLKWRKPYVVPSPVREQVLATA